MGQVNLSPSTRVYVSTAANHCYEGKLTMLLYLRESQKVTENNKPRRQQEMSKLLTVSVSAIHTAPVTCQPHSTINTPTTQHHQYSCNKITSQTIFSPPDHPTLHPSVQSISQSIKNEIWKSKMHNLNQSNEQIKS